MRSRLEFVAGRGWVLSVFEAELGDWVSYFGLEWRNN